MRLVIAMVSLRTTLGGRMSSAVRLIISLIDMHTLEKILFCR